jgi:hypothetical protein
MYRSLYSNLDGGYRREFELDSLLGFENTNIQAGHQFDHSVPWRKTFLKLKELMQTVKAPVHAMNLMSPGHANGSGYVKAEEVENGETNEEILGVEREDFGEDGWSQYSDAGWSGDQLETTKKGDPDLANFVSTRQFQFALQREILTGNNVTKIWTENWFGDMSKHEAEAALKGCSAKVLAQLLDVLRKVLCGVLPILGPARTGKTQLCMLLAHQRMLRGALADAKRECVSLTRHICAFVIIGDISVANTVVSKVPVASKLNEEGGKASEYDGNDKVEVRDVQILKDTFGWVGAWGRIVHKNANTVTPATANYPFHRYFGCV